MAGNSLKETGYGNSVYSNKGVAFGVNHLSLCGPSKLFDFSKDSAPDSEHLTQKATKPEVITAKSIKFLETKILKPKLNHRAPNLID